jgi:hypothetical protein
LAGIPRIIGYFLVSILIPLLIAPTIVTPSLSQPQSEAFSTWNDPQGDFSIEYPSDWTVKEKENRFDPTDVTFTSPASVTNGFVAVDYEDTMIEEYDRLIEAGVDESMIWERIFDGYIEGFSPSIANFREVEDRDFSKYTVNGETAASVVFAGEIIGQEIAGLLVVSIVDDRIFNLSYGASQTEFDKVLPTVEHMISSIKVPASGTEEETSSSEQSSDDSTNLQPEDETGNDVPENSQDQELFG